MSSQFYLYNRNITNLSQTALHFVQHTLDKEEKHLTTTTTGKKREKNLWKSNRGDMQVLEETADIIQIQAAAELQIGETG